jgi:predicted HAD superfamily Cof-like phosphohydrolase
MNAEQSMVAEYHERFGLPHNDAPCWPGDDAHRIRVAVLEEELAEFRNAGEARNLVEMADALGDLLYATYGAAVACGIDLAPVFEEIHRSNMSKTGGRHSADGKARKGERYHAPELEAILDYQLGHSCSPELEKVGRPEVLVT